MKIPHKIEVVDIRIKQLLMSCYKEERGFFPNFLNACTNETAYNDILKYWKSIPLRIIKSESKNKSSIKIESDIKSTITANEDKIENQRNRFKISKPKLPLTTEVKEKLRSYMGNDFSVRRETMTICRFSSYDYDEISAYISTLKNEILNQLIADIKKKKGLTDEFVTWEAIASNGSLKHLSKEQQKILHHFYIENYNTETNKNPETPSTASNKIETVESASETVPWQAIEFKNGSVWIYNSKANGDILLKSRGHLTIKCNESRECFNKIKKLFVQRLPKIKAIVANNYLVRLVSELDIQKAIRILQDIDTYEDWESNDSPMIIPSHFNAIKNIDHDKVLRELAKRKSKYLDYLVSKQSPHRKVVPCKELLCYENNEFEEDAFIFTINTYRSDYEILVLENVNAARSTIAFVVTKPYYEKALKVVFDFIRSNELNKRQRLHYNRFDFTGSGISYYKCINHSQLYEWGSKINI